MTDCPGLILCTPAPTPGPTGLTADEVAALGTLAGTAAGFLILLGVITIVVGVAFAVYLGTR